MILDCGERRMLVPGQNAQPGELVKALAKQGGKLIELRAGSNGKLYLPVALESEDVALLIDTGAALSTLEPEYVQDKAWKRSRNGSTVRTLGQSAPLETVTVPLTKFGAFQVPNIAYALVPGGGRQHQPQVGGRKVVGIVGMQTMMPLRFVIDFGSRQALVPINQLNAKQNPPAA
jgi:hypothetical protein